MFKSAISGLYVEASIFVFNYQTIFQGGSTTFLLIWASYESSTFWYPCPTLVLSLYFYFSHFDRYEGI